MSADKQFKYPALICRLMWVGLLVAGLWPFNFFPETEWNRCVTRTHEWASFFTLWANLQQRFLEAESARRVPGREALLEPGSLVGACNDMGWGGTVVTNHDPAQHQSFAIDQSLSDLVVRSLVRDQVGQLSFKNLWLDDIFR
jgi:hypothetical protein